MIEVHLVSWNRPKMTELVIKTLYRNTTTPFLLCVLDNGSDAETQHMLSNLYDHGFIHRYVQESQNKGLEYARQTLLEGTEDAEFFVDLDNDCLAPVPVGGADWLTRLEDLMRKYPEYAAIACRTQVMIGTGNIFQVADEFGDDIVDFPHPGGSFRMMRTSMVREVGGWDRKQEGRGAEERYIGGKLHGAGYETAFATHIVTQHLFGTRGVNGTDRWGYASSMTPDQSGHSDIWHPALSNGDDFDAVAAFSGVAAAKEYFGHGDSNHKTD